MKSRPFRFSLGLLIALAVVTIIGIDVVRPTTVIGQGYSYEYDVRATSQTIFGASTYVVDINILDQYDDYTDYKNENDARIADWVANPGSAPVVLGKPVKVTFANAMSYTDTMNIIGPLSTEVVQYRIVGSSTSYPDRAVDGVGPIDQALIGSMVDPACGAAVDPMGLPDPTGCEVITYAGVIDVVFAFSGSINDLDLLRGNSIVYLADATAIGVIDELSLQGISQNQIEVVGFPFPSLRN